MRVETDVIIIRGAPGSGKSQTAKSLSKYFAKGVRFEVDIIRQMVISVDWQNQQEHINMLNASTKLVFEFLHYGFKPVIVVDTFSGDKIKGYLNSLFQLNKNIEVKIFGLYTSPKELKRRLDVRTTNQFKDFSICQKLNDDVLKWKHESEFQLDTTGVTSDFTASRIYSEIK